MGISFVKFFKYNMNENCLFSGAKESTRKYSNKITLLLNYYTSGNIIFKRVISSSAEGISEF